MLPIINCAKARGRRPTTFENTDVLLGGNGNDDARPETFTSARKENEGMCVGTSPRLGSEANNGRTLCRGIRGIISYRLYSVRDIARNVSRTT